MPCPPRETFQIGWICALPIEAAAAKEMLDENFGLLDAQDLSDSNIYTLGRIGKHHVVIACLPGGQCGITSATTVATNMIRTFSKSLRIGLMVGVGGGIPSAAHDIRLGDVVISCPKNTCGGVVQYDMGKVEVGGRISPGLLTAINLMRAAELTDDPHYPKYLLKAIGRNARTRKNFVRPQQDRLFKLEHYHYGTASTCDGCLAEWEETRSERETSDPQPHYGIIASGNAVIKDGFTREQLRLDTGALCFEMEAAGLMMDFPCIAIRGVCDYADTHKNKQWQGYAALVAASYAKELLGYVPISSVLQENLMNYTEVLKKEIKSINQQLHRVYDQQEQHHNELKNIALTDKQRGHQVFKVTNYEEQKNINPRRAEGTCQWALGSLEYIHWWENCGNDLLWVSADPGCGKSVLARSIIDDYIPASSPAVTICYFFFKDNDEQDSLGAALCAMLHQLFSQRPYLLHHALPSWEKNGDRLRQEADELWRIFLTATSADVSCKTICVLDALDECREDDQRRLIAQLGHFHCQSNSSTQNGWLKFLVTSRPYDHIQHQFQAVKDSFPHIHLKGEEENDRIHEEIDLVVKIRVKELAKTAFLSSKTTQELESQLLRMEHRTYLWLHLAICDIRTTFENSLRPAEESIRVIPPSVNAAYEKILSRVPSEQVDTVRKILKIIVAARRPLTTQEMGMALGIAICSRSRHTAEAGLDSAHLDKKLRRLCGLFVFTNNSKIYLIHQTARKFLIKTDLSSSEYACSLKDAESQMALICLRYLLTEGLERKKGQSTCIPIFLEYSSVYWTDHVRHMKSTENQELEPLLREIYNTTGELFLLWFPVFWKAKMQKKRTPMMNDAIHLAALNGHEQVVHDLLAEDESRINIVDSTGSHAVMWASLNGYEVIVQMILDHGAEVNTALYDTAL
ncbi:hypothetical protein N7526_001497 [Penicillium atrosanguineum]|nr:hypothetical protein N7526_001497 [Penicillium atrosanguineum]